MCGRVRQWWTGPPLLAPRRIPPRPRRQVPPSPETPRTLSIDLSALLFAPQRAARRPTGLRRRTQSRHHLQRPRDARPAPYTAQGALWRSLERRFGLCARAEAPAAVVHAAARRPARGSASCLRAGELHAHALHLKTSMHTPHAHQQAQAVPRERSTGTVGRSRRDAPAAAGDGGRHADGTGAGAPREHARASPLDVVARQQQLLAAAEQLHGAAVEVDLPMRRGRRQSLGVALWCRRAGPERERQRSRPRPCRA